jgi:hypothetical protein
MQMVSIGILALIYILFKERLLAGMLKWVISMVLFIVGIVGQFIAAERGDRLALWCIASALILCIIIEVLKTYTINNRSHYVPSDEIINNDLSDQEKFEISKIALVVLVLWFIIGLIITR